MRMTTDSPEHFDDDERAVKESLDAVAAGLEGRHGRRLWTNAIKEKLVEVGKARGYHTNTGGCAASDGCEWLWDLCWFVLEDEDKDRHILRTPLILESEWDWNRDGLHGDFAKLVMGRAEHRVLVYEMPGEEQWFQDEIRSNAGTQPGDRYLLARWDDAAERFVYTHLIV